jgi:hypothetical protein
MFALLAVAAPMTACKSTEGHDRAETTSNKVHDLAGVAGQTQTHLDKTLNALERVVATKDTGPKPAFDSFVSELGAFHGSFADLTKSRDALRASAEAWFTEFDKQNSAIQDEGLRADGAKRLTGFREQVRDVSKQVDDLMMNTKALELRLGDLRTYLGNDLTPGGIDSVSGRIKDTASEGRKLAESLGKLSKSSDTLANGLAATRPPPPAPAPAK